MLPVREIMTTNVITARKDLPILDAAEIMVTNHITGIPVVDEDNNLIGILSEYDVLKLLKEATPDENRTINDFMTRDVTSFEETTPMIKIWEFFVANPSKRRVPIVRDGKLVGVLSRGDIVKQIVKLMRAQGSGKAGSGG